MMSKMVKIIEYVMVKYNCSFSAPDIAMPDRIMPNIRARIINEFSGLHRLLFRLLDMKSEYTETAMKMLLNSTNAYFNNLSCKRYTFTLQSILPSRRMDKFIDS